MTQKKFKGIPDRILSHGQNPEELILRYKQSGVGKVDHWDKKLDIDNQLTSKDAFCIDELIKSRNNYSCGSSDNFEMFLQEEGRKSITESDSISSKSDKIRKETKFNNGGRYGILSLLNSRKKTDTAMSHKDTILINLLENGFISRGKSFESCARGNPPH